MKTPTLTRVQFSGPVTPRDLPPIPASCSERLALLCKTILNRSQAEARTLAARLLIPDPKGSTEIRAWFDGSCQPTNPGGHGGAGALVQRNGVTIWERSEYLGRSPEISNNVAEYAGAILVMRYLLAEGITAATVYGDSSLVVYQLNGRQKAKRGLYLTHYREAIELRRRLPDVRFVLIPRGQNTEADALARKAVEPYVRA